MVTKPRFLCLVSNPRLGLNCYGLQIYYTPILRSVREKCGCLFWHKAIFFHLNRSCGCHLFPSVADATERLSCCSHSLSQNGATSLLHLLPSLFRGATLSLALSTDCSELCSPLPLEPPHASLSSYPEIFFNCLSSNTHGEQSIFLAWSTSEFFFLPYHRTHTLCSTSLYKLVIPQIKQSRLGGNYSFSYLSTKYWNSLSAHICSINSISLFRKKWDHGCSNKLNPLPKDCICCQSALWVTACFTRSLYHQHLYQRPKWNAQWTDIKPSHWDKYLSIT